MANPASTNIDGSNPGPNVVTLPDTSQLPIGNVWKLANITFSLTPGTIANATNKEVTLTVTGLLTTDAVFVNAPGAANPGIGIAGSRVSAAGVLAINFTNGSAATTAAPAGTYILGVLRVQPNWTQPASGAAIDW